MTKQIINIGSAANDRSGDSLRASFDKVNQNFTELYSALGADIQIPVQTGNDGKFLTTDGATLSWSNISSEIGTANTGFIDNRIYNLNGPILSNDDLVHGATARLSLPEYGDTVNPIGLYNNYGNLSVLLGSAGTITNTWTFDTDGSLTVPARETVTFTAVCDEAHMVIPTGLDGDAWSFEVSFVVNANGTVETQITNDTPWSSNPGYATGKEFTYTEDDHGIPGYTFTLTFTDVQNPGPFMWTTNLGASPAPEYPSTVVSSGAITLTANNKSFVLGSDGVLTLPGRIIFPNGTASVYGNTDLVGLFPSPTSNSGLEIAAGSTANLYNQGDVVISSNWNQESGSKSWSFRPSGELEVPADGSIKQNYSWTRTVDPVVSAGAGSVVWISNVDYISSAKLTIQVECNETGDDTGWHSQACEAIIACRGYANGASGPTGIPEMTVYAITYTSTLPLVTFTVQRNPTTNFVEVVGTLTAAAGGNAALRIHSVEMSTRD